VILEQTNNVYPSHISIYMALYQIAGEAGFNMPFQISRSRVKALSRVASNACYHACIADLQAWGLIVYLPDYNPAKGSTLYLVA
jgi:hypothetical protein